ncbi:MAG: U32 family peptidase [Puniceicoccaceae bacterium]|nr:MAG: U32 family peptidase [Puniceicoccaceae bacterium]
MSSAPHPPELLAPAGNWDCARAAVANGADAVYFGLPAMNARLRADNFTTEDLPRLMDFLHGHGVRGYLTVNTLAFPAELAAAAELFQTAEAAGVDAIIVQDLGLVRLARAVAPALEIHASTQMTLTSPEGVHFARSLGVERAVLARELSLRELERFPAPEAGGLPLEVFVHGALCVAYSGQCLTSEALGQRSANRGECAQACRMPYDFLVDGERHDLGGRHYLLSPQDLAAVDDLPRLVELGITCFKIEGRLKSPEYVAAVTRVYRQALDRALEGRPAPVPPEDRYQLEMTFSRGLFPGWLHGVNHQELVHARFGTRRGPRAGTVRSVGRHYVEVDDAAALNPGDGVVFDTGGNPDHQPGGRIHSLQGDRWYFPPGKPALGRVRPGMTIWKTSDPRLEANLRRSFAELDTTPLLPVTLAVRGAPGEPLRIEAECGGRRAGLATTERLQPARGRSLDTDTLRRQLGRLGGTGYRLAGLACAFEAPCFLPLGALNRARRDLVAALGATTEERAPAPSRPDPRIVLDRLLEKARGEAADPPAPDAPPLLTVLCRTLEQLEAALEAEIPVVYLDFEDIRRYAEAVAAAGPHPASRIFLATPRIQKAGEQGFFGVIERARPHGVLLRNLGGLEYFRETPFERIGDFSLNVANALTARTLLDHGLDRLTLSCDLNHLQVADLLRQAGPEPFELIVHHHMPMFHMEHCVYAAFLSEGKSHLDCGRPCERHRVSLRDRVGVAHPVGVDVGCRNTVYHAKAQSAAAFVDAFRALGLNRFRIELLNETPAETTRLITAYRELLGGAVDAATLLDRLGAANQLGVTGGTLLAV